MIPQQHLSALNGDLMMSDKTKDDYLKMLRNGYELCCLYDNIESKHEYLSSHIFEFTSYDTGFDVEIVDTVLETFSVLNSGKLREYIRVDANYHKYLWVCNLKLMTDLIEWGTSVRGAWWNFFDHKKKTVGIIGLADDDENQIYPIEFNLTEWKNFVDAILCFMIEGNQ